MAETQKEKIERLKKELEQEKVQQAWKDADLLNDKLHKLQDAGDTEFANSPHFHQLINENEMLRSRVNALESRLQFAQEKKRPTS